MPSTVTTNTLHELGEQAREQHSILDTLPITGLNVYGNCDNISQHILQTLHTEHDIPVHALELWRASVGETGELHYVPAIKTEHVTDIDQHGYVVVDAAIDQFCDEQRNAYRVETSYGSYESLPTVGIYPPDAPERAAYYHPSAAEYDPTTTYVGRDVGFTVDIIE